MKKKVAVGLLVVLIGIQFIRVDKVNPPVVAENDFIALTKPPQDIVLILKNSCYDCHSNETAYPWYFDVAPVSWWAKDHVNDGRKHLNFSTWGNYPADRQAHKLDECYTEVEEDEMPLGSYTLAHSSAKLSAEQKQALLKWLQGLGDEKE